MTAATFRDLLKCDRAPGWDAFALRDALRHLAGPNEPKVIEPAIRKIADLLDINAELLAALEHAVRWHDQLHPTDIARFEAAIAKAKGGVS